MITIAHTPVIHINSFCDQNTNSRRTHDMETLPIYHLFYKKCFWEIVNAKTRNVFEQLELLATGEHTDYFSASYMEILLTDEARRVKYISRILKLLEHFLLLHFTFHIHASNVVKTWRLILQVVQVTKNRHVSICKSFPSNSPFCNLQACCSWQRISACEPGKKSKMG